jgi:protein TonB
MPVEVSSGVHSCKRDFTLEDTMFADSILETSWGENSRRGWTTLTSFALQALTMLFLLLLPLLRPESLPFYHRIATPVSLGRPIEPLAARPPVGSSTNILQSNFVNPRLIMPTRIPTGVTNVAEESLPEDPGSTGPYVPGAARTGLPQGILGSSGNTIPVMPPPPPTASRPIRISTMSEGSLIHRVQPGYPGPAKIAHVQGPVVLAAIISKEGTIENLHVLKGHPLLVGAAVDAVRQWRYRPYILNREPVEVETQITVNFSLSGD